MAIKKNYAGVDGPLSDGNLTIMVVPSAEIEAVSDVTAALLNGASAVDITYDLTTDGYQHTPGNEEITQNRLTRPYEKKRQGKQTDTLQLQYGYDPETGEGETQADTVLVTGAKVHVIERRGVDHETDFAAGDKIKIYPGEVGRKTDDPPVAAAEFTRSVAILLDGEGTDETVLAAGQ